jgi:acyl-CoA thioesterase
MAELGRRRLPRRRTATVIARMSTAFERATSNATIDESWSAPLGPNGGYIAAIAVRALESVIDGQIRSLTCHYLRRPHPGPIDLRPEVVRDGRRMATGRLSGFQDGKEVLAAVAAFSKMELDEIARWSPLPPDVDPPGDDWAPFQEGMPPLMQHLKMAPRLGGAPFSGQELAPGEAPEAGGWIELADPPAQIDAAVVALLTDAWWPPSLNPLSTPAGAPTIDLTIHFRTRLPLPMQPVLGVYKTAASMEGFIEEDGELYLPDGTLLAQSRQLALLTG